MAIMVWYNIKQRLPEADTTVRIVAQQWAWNFVHPGPDNELDTDDDINTVNELHVEVGTVYHYELESEGRAPRLLGSGVPPQAGRDPGPRDHGLVRAHAAGEYDIQCAEICGIGHGIMGARIIVETPEEHAAWMSQGNPGELAAR